MSKKAMLTVFAVAVIAGPFLLGGIEPIAAQQAELNSSVDTVRSQSDANTIDALYGIALQEGAVNVMAFDPRDATWMADAFEDAFPGITVNIRSSLGHLPMIISDSRSIQPGIDVVLTSLIEGNALYEEGLLTRTDFGSFGAPDNHVVLNSSFAYTNSIVYTVVYDSRRVGDTATIPPEDPDNPNKIPVTWLDLLDESYAGKISTNPFVLPRAIAGLGTVWGVSAAEDYARQLSEDQRLLASFGDTKRFFLDETQPQMYYLAQVNTLTEQWEAQNLTTDYVVPEPVIIEQQGIGVMATAPHPAAAALLAGWLASPESMAIRKNVAASANLLPDSNDELALRLRAMDAEIVYDTPETTSARGELAAIIQPYISPGYSFYDRNPQSGPISIFQPPSQRPSIGEAINVLLDRLRSGQN